MRGVLAGAMSACSSTSTLTLIVSRSSKLMVGLIDPSSLKQVTGPSMIIDQYLVSCVSRARLKSLDHRRKLPLLQSIGIIRRISTNSGVGTESNEMSDSLKDMAGYVKGEPCVLA